MKNQIKGHLQATEANLWSHQPGTQALLKCLSDEEHELLEAIVIACGSSQPMNDLRLSARGRLQFVRELKQQLEEMQNE
jgi:hypothetical protein